MNNDTGIQELSPGFWFWRARHPFWSEDDDYPQVVTSVFAESGEERMVIDAIVPSLDCIGLWEKLDSRPPTMAVVTMPDHVRDIDIFTARYGLKAFGPMFYFRDQVPNTELIPVVADEKLPGDIIPLYDGRGRAETPIYIPRYKTIVFGDALTERNGKLRVWDSYSHEKREIPALKDMLQLPFERVIISHCEENPVHTRDEFEEALRLKPFR